MSSGFDHRYFARYKFDVFAYRLGDAGDIKILRPRMRFIEKPLVYHYGGSEPEAFMLRHGEAFLE